MNMNDEKRFVRDREQRPQKGALAAAVVILLCGALGLVATEKKKKTVMTQPPSTTIEPGQTVPVSNLPVAIKISPDLLTKKKSSGCHAFSPAVKKAWANAQKSFQALSESISRFEETYAAACNECKNKTYTQQEMAAAGCLPTDTVAECSHKLFNRCVSSIQLGAAHMQLCMDILKMSETAKKLEDDFFGIK